MLTYKITTSDNYPISVTKFEPAQSNGKVILICSATAVKQQFYINFAAAYAEEGYTVYTYDYRGIGLSKPASLRGFNGNMRDWANKDFQSVTAHLKEQHPGSKKYLIGHSIGGGFIGMTKAYQDYDAFVTVGSQLGYWKYFDNKRKPIVLWVFYIIVPLLSKIMGYFPSKLKQLGEPLPKGAALDWKTLITNPRSYLALAEQSENYYEKINQPMLMISVEDDWMATKSAVDKLAELAFVNAKVQRKHILLSDANTNAIGHLNFFRKKHRAALWGIPADWLRTVGA